MDKTTKLKLIGMVIGVILLVLIIGVPKLEKVIKYDGKTYRVGYYGEIDLSNDKVVLSTYEDFVKYFEYFGKDGEKVISDYKEKFFKKESLAVLYVITGSGNTYIEYKEAKVNGDKVVISYNKKTEGEVGTTVMGGYFVVVEVPKDVKKISDKD
jgi:hypothetical protein